MGGVFPPRGADALRARHDAGSDMHLAGLRDSRVAMMESADLGDAHCPDGEQELPGLEDEVHGGPDAAVATSIASGLEDGLSSA